MADTSRKADDKAAAEAAAELRPATTGTIDGALGPNWQAWQDHVKANVQPVDADNDGDVEVPEPVVPLLVYGDGPNDYIATSIDAGQVVVQDGNDPTGKAWKFPLESFMRFVARAHGKQLDGDDEPKGDNPLVAAAKQQERTNALRDAEHQAAAGAQRTGETRTNR